jgi:hypothetical protein
MRFLLLNQFYPPDAEPTGWSFLGLAREAGLKEDLIPKSLVKTK